MPCKGDHERDVDVSTAGKRAPLHVNVKKVLIRTAGVSFALLSALAGAISGVFFKLTGEMDSFEIVVFRGLATFLLSATCSLYKRKKVLLVKNRYLWFAASGNAISNALFYLAGSHMNYGDTSAISLLCPILVGIIGHFYLKELYTKVDAVITVVIIFGVLMVIQPDFLVKLLYPNSDDIFKDVTNRNITNATILKNNLNTSEGFINMTLSFNDIVNRTENFTEIGGNNKPRGLVISREIAGVIALSSAIAVSCNYIFTRRYGRVFFPTALAQYGLLNAVLSAIPATALGLWHFPPSPLQWIYLFCYISTALLSQILYLAAFRKAPAALVTTVLVFDIPLSYCLQLVVLGHYPTVLPLVGAVIITCGALVFSSLRYRRERRETEKQKKLAAEEMNCVDSVELVALTGSLTRTRVNGHDREKGSADDGHDGG
ncbi:uncharacterized protein LOC135499691 [Lineus longissimus]|uniref:uncharacterized protein LOC135499691 n=1 Tax=Lineus longissimus TaxID=88925 RepID=UPI00315C8933